MRLWFDDVRPAPPGWTWAKTVAEAQAFLASGDVEEASLDHDIGGPDCVGYGEPKPTDGTDLVRWMMARKILDMHPGGPYGAWFPKRTRWCCDFCGRSVVVEGWEMPAQWEIRTQRNAEKHACGRCAERG
jgi:hypothetical protein